jgi:peptidoglycan hydrolase CwlO-like protein
MLVNVVDVLFRMVAVNDVEDVDEDVGEEDEEEEEELEEEDDELDEDDELLVTLELLVLETVDVELRVAK